MLYQPPQILLVACSVGKIQSVGEDDEVGAAELFRVVSVRRDDRLRLGLLDQRIG